MALRSRFFGYDRAEVEQYFDRITSLQETETSKTKSELAKLEAENSLIKGEIEELARKSKDLPSHEVLELSLNRIQTVCDHLKRYEDEDFCNIFSNEYLMKEKLKENIINLEKEMQETKENIKKELDQITKIIKTSNLSLVTAGSRTQTSSEESSKDDAGESYIRLISNPTADGTSLFEELDKLKDNSQKTKPIKEKESSTIFEQTPFWSKSDSSSDKNKEKKLVDKKTHYQNNQGYRLGENEILATQEEYGRHSQNHDLSFDNDTATGDDLKTRIDLARYRYIIGKIAGEDLVGNSGELIIKKNEEITNEVIEAAQRENKLSDLIINMLAQGMDE